MTLTRITTENIDYFYGLLKRYWDERIDSQVFIGAVDGDGEAVAACAAESVGQELLLLFVGVSPPRQHEGIGRDFLIELCAYAFETGFTMVFSNYFKDQDEESSWEEFLKLVGFSIQEIPLTRNAYLIDDIIGSRKESVPPLPEGYSILRPSRLTLAQAIRLQEIAGQGKEQGVYEDADIILSDKNRYGGVLFKGDTILVAVSATEFFSDIRIDAIIIRTAKTKEIGYLLDYVFAQANKEKNPPKNVIYELSDDKMDQTIANMLAARDITPVNVQQGMIAYLEREELDGGL